MEVELAAALMAGVVALLSAAGTVLSSVRNADRTAANARAVAQVGADNARAVAQLGADNARAVEQLRADNARAVEELKIEYDRLKADAQRQREISNFSEPLARAAYDLQSRIYNILKQDLVGTYLVRGNERGRDYVVESTTFLVAQYFCWTELVRREIQFIDLGESSRTGKLLHLQDDIYSVWGTDRHPPPFRVFAGEQRAIGEALIQVSARGPECIGYGVFLKAFGRGTNPLIDALRTDVASMDRHLSQAAARLTAIQHAMINLLQLLDPEYLRFPQDRRSKV